MTGNLEPLINSLPLTTKLHRSDYVSSEERFDDEIRISCSSSSGIVICYSDGTGEVLTQETFEDTGLHFIFTKTTIIQKMHECDPLGIGSVVQIFWSRSFERIIRGSHIVVHIEKMDIYKCSPFRKESILVTFNSQSSAGVAVGVNERNIMVAFHPNCFPEIRYETLRALNESRTEFQLSCKYKYRENTNRMVRVTVASAPFKVEISGSIEKIPYLVIKTYDDVRGYGGVAVVTKVVRNIFMEAMFLSTSEAVFFDSNACHSNILDKVAVGSLISVLASPTFPSSCFKWYGYDVAMLNVRLDKKVVHCMGIENKCFAKPGEDEVFEFPAVDENTFFGSASNEVSCSFAVQTKFHQKHSDKHLSDALPNIHNSMSNVLNSNMSILFLIAVSFPRETLEETIQSYFFFSKEQSGTTISNSFYSVPLSLRNTITRALEPFGLNKIIKTSVIPNNEMSEHTASKLEENKDETSFNAVEVFASMMNSEGFALNQTVKQKFILPDTAWGYNEKRFIGVHDDLQWSLMSTFCQNHENLPKNRIDGDKRVPLQGGWWYRRTVPREVPIKIVKEFNVKRNIIEDCE